jgi:hypothetical protein
MKKQINIIKNTIEFINEYEKLKDDYKYEELINLLDNKYKNNLIKIEKWCENYEINYEIN